MENTRSKLLTVAVLALGLAGMLPATMIDMPAADLHGRADAVLTGTVTSVSSHWDETHSTISTDVTIRSEVFKKGVAATFITLRLPGGEVGDVGLAVEDIPTFRVGEKTTVCLVRGREAGVYELFGAYQGKLAGEQGRSTDALYSYSGYHRSIPNCDYYINSVLPSDWSTAIQAGDAAWDAAGSRFRFGYLGATTRTGPTYDGYNIVWRNNLGSGGILAQNSYWYNRRTKLVSENDIVFNTYYPWATDGRTGYYDVQNIATHELGHCLVLNDLYKSTQSAQTMYGYAGAGETYKRTLETGDKDGIKYIYGIGLDGVKAHTKIVTTVAK